ncbi:MAG: FKBP-type peptidyl-prolyl cis-trans isomerase [Chitinophagaceae bacterium]
MSVVKKGDTVKVHYTGTLAGGEQFDSSAGRDPLEFEVGAGMMIPGFDKGVEGMALGDKKQIHVTPEDGYGEWDEQNVIPFPKENVPADMVLEPGQPLTLRNDQGQPLQVVVAEVKDDVVILDANHFLAGKDLVFDVEIVHIEPKSLIIMP